MILAIRTRLNLVLLLLVFLFVAGDLFSQSKIWVGSWSCANYAAGSGNTPPSPYLANNTLRQIVRVSIGGDSLRVKFTNKTCATPVTMNSVNIAVSKGGSLVDASTITFLKFKGSKSVTMNGNSSVISDQVAFALTPNMRVAITIHYGQAASTADITSHVGSRTDSYLISGDHSSSADFGGSVVTAHWFHINTIDVLAPDTAGCIGVLGNSITDGYGLSGGLQNRWTDIFSQQLLDDKRTRNIGVLNLGIGGTTLSGSGLSRYKEDLLNQSGLRWIIIFYGVNDIGGGQTATTVTSAYQKIIDDAHAMNIKVYGATITPFKGHSYYTETRELVRNTVNDWIRTPGNFDACIDLDKAIRDPNDQSKFLAKYSNDWLHPNVAGYELLGKSVNLDLFTEIENNQTLFAKAGADRTFIDHGNTGSCAVKLNGSGSSVFGGEIASYVWSLDGKQIATGESPTVTISVGTHVITLTVSDKAGNTDTDEVIISVVKDSGVWLEAECGTVGSLWNTETDNLASNGKYVTIKPGNNSTSNAPSNSSGLLAYTFVIEEEGTYNLYTRLICPTANDDSFWIRMDNGSFSMWNGITSPSWQWHLCPSGFSLSKGTHILTIGFREDGAKLDKLWITKNSADLLNAGSDAGNCNSTSINLDIINAIGVFPNPVDKDLYVTLTDRPSIVSLCNINGEEVFRKDNHSNDLTINMTNYHSGIYLMKITDQNKTSVRKIIKP